MVDETSGTEKFEAKHRAPNLEDRERMTEKALAAIRQTGPAATLEKCCALVNQINVELLKREKIEPYAVAELQAYLTRANAVIKKRSLKPRECRIRTLVQQRVSFLVSHITFLATRVILRIEPAGSAPHAVLGSMHSTAFTLSCGHFQLRPAHPHSHARARP